MDSPTEKKSRDGDVDRDMYKEKKKGGSSSNLTKCSSQTCKVIGIVKRIRKGEKGNVVSKADLDHLRADHFGTFADFGWECSHKLREETLLLTKEVERLQAKVDKLNAVSNAPTGDPPVADPRNHVDGFCDALFTHPSGAILKCTDAARYGSTRCTMHQKFSHGIAVETKKK